jgi:hypothetical protein
MADKRCRHGFLPGQCAECGRRPRGVPRMVWITKEGDAFHRDRDCAALIAGQRYAERLGQRTHEPESVAYTTARASGRSACLYCFPPEVI